MVISQPVDSMGQLSSGNSHGSPPRGPSPSGGPRSQGAISGAAVMTVARVVNVTVSLVATAIIARLLDKEDFGVVMMVGTATGFFAIFSDFGLSLVTVQRAEITQGQLTALFWVNCGFGMLLSIATLAVSPLLVWYSRGDTRLYAVTALMALTFPISTLRVQHEALLKRHMYFRRLAVVRVSGIVLGAIVGVSAAFAGMGYWSLAMQLLATEAGATIASWLAMNWRPGLPGRCDGLRSMLGFAGALTAHGMVGYWASYLDNLLIGRYCGYGELGLYSTSYQLMMRPISLAGYGVGEAAVPAMAKTLQADGDVRQAYRRMLTVTCLLGLPICVAGSCWAGDVVNTVLGSKFLGAIPMLRILFLAAMARMLCASTGWVYVVLGRPGRMLRWQLMWTPFVILSFILGIRWGAVGVAAAYAIANWIAFLPSFFYCFKGTAFSIFDMVEPVAAPLFCTVFSTALALGGQLLLFPDLQLGKWRLLVRVLLACALYAATTVAFVPIVREAWNRFRRNWFATPEK